MQMSDDIRAPQQSRETHARMFARYLNNCTLSDLESILQAARDCSHAQLNYGTNAQLAEQDKKRDIVQKAVSHMLASDLRYNDQMIADAKKV